MISREMPGYFDCRVTFAEGDLLKGQFLVRDLAEKM